MRKEPIKYAYTFDIADGFIFSDFYDTREKSIEQARKEWENSNFLKETYPNKKVWICKMIIYKENSNFVDEVIEILQSNAENPKYMNLTDDHKEIFNKKLKDTVLKFQKDYGYEPNFWDILNGSEEEVQL